MSPYHINDTINLLYHADLNYLFLDQKLEYGKKDYITFNTDSSRKVKSTSIINSLSLFDLNYEETKSKMANFLSTYYSDVLNGPIIGIVMYELGSVIFTDSGTNIYTHTVIYADILDCIQYNKSECKSYQQSYRFSNIQSAFNYYCHYSNRINVNLAW